VPAAQQNVLRFDIPVDHTVGVGIGQRVRHFIGNPHGDIDREPPIPLEPLPEGLTLHERHHEVRNRRAGADVHNAGVEDWKDVRMLQAGGQLDFPQEALDTVGPTQLGAHHLERHRALVAKISGEVNGGHTADTDLPLESVTALERGLQPFGDVAHDRLNLATADAACPLLSE
jgi:hypothetical protein